MNKDNRVSNIVTWILSVGLSGFLCEPFKKLINKIVSLFGKFNLNMEGFDKDIHTFNVSTLDIISFAVLVIILFVILFFVRKYIRSISRKAKIERLKKNNRYEDDEFLATWTVYEDSFTSKNPFIHDLTFYCKRHHPVPLRMSNGRCTDPNCPNYHKSINVHDFKNWIESILAAEKDKLGLE